MEQVEKVDYDQLFIESLDNEDKTNEFMAINSEKLVNYVIHITYKPTPILAAKRFCLTMEDFQSAGNLGLWKAYRTYKPEKGNKWSSYAARCITNEINFLIRKNVKHSEVAFNAVALDTRFHFKEDHKGEGMTPTDVIATDTDDFTNFIESELAKEILEMALPKLKSRAKKVLKIRLENPGILQREIGDLIGCTRSYVSRIDMDIKDTIKKVCEKLGE